MWLSIMSNCDVMFLLGGNYSIVRVLVAWCLVLDHLLISWFNLCIYLFLGVEIYCAPTADARDVWQASMTHIALEGGCFVLSANQFCRRKDYPPPPEYVFSGTEEDLTPDSVVCAGGSVIISPSGTVLAGPNYDGEALISADLGMSLVSTICTFLNFSL